MIRIENIVLGMCATNCYAVFDGGAKTPGGYVDDGQLKEAVIIDPAADAACIEAMIARYKLKPVAVLLTHGHFDHIGGAAELKKASGAKVYALAEEKKVCRTPELNLSAQMPPVVTIEADEWLTDGQTVETAGISFQVIATPGHTVGGCCYYCKEGGFLFSGDTLFEESVGRTDFPTGSMSSLVRSVKEKLFVLPEDTKVYPGHGDITTIGREKQYNPYCQ